MEIPIGVCAQLLHEVEFAVAPSLRCRQDPFDQVPRVLQLAHGELSRSWPSPPRCGISRRFMSRQVVGAVGAAHGSEPSIADVNAEGLDVTAQAPSRILELHELPLLHDVILQFQGEMDVPERGYVRYGDFS